MKIPSEKLDQIDVLLESTYPNARDAGNQMAALMARHPSHFGMSQIRGLESIIVSATRFSEILNYIKNQTGKDRNNVWPRVAPMLIEQLEGLENSAVELGADDPSLVLAIKMKLARGWGKQVITHCLYQHKIHNQGGQG